MKMIDLSFDKRSHVWIDARSLAMKQLIAEKIRRNPALFACAMDTLQHWKRLKRPAPAALKQWERILRRNSLEKVLRILTEKSERGNRLRQCDPFCGILTERERQRFLLEYEKS